MAPSTFNEKMNETSLLNLILLSLYHCNENILLQAVHCIHEVKTLTVQ